MPWEDVRFLYAKDELAKLCKTQTGLQELPLMIKSPTVLPKLATIKGVAVEFKDLNKVNDATVTLATSSSEMDCNSEHFNNKLSPAILDVRLEFFR